MDFRYKPAIRAISLTVLFFFCWTFGGMVDIAYAIKNSSQHIVDSSQENPTKNTQKSKTQKPEEKFQKTIEDIEKTLADTATDTDTKKNKLKTKRSEIEGLDTAIKRQFSDTERFLKGKGLPPEILERHRNFVKHYEDNLNELKNNLDEIQKHSAKSRELSDSIDKTKRFLERVKPPRKHKKLDPNKLPHRSAEPVWIEPRTKPEEFTEGKELRAKGKEYKQVLVASNGSLNGLLSQSSTLYAQSSMQIALADPPTSADLAETIEVKFTPAIQAKATELGHNPVKIYNWVRNNIEFVPTYGSIQGANMCLQTKQCNAIDTSSLLIALLRSSGIHARYVQGTIELPIEKVKNWVGGFTDSMEALRLLASAKIPTKGMTVGGEIKYARLENVWVEAWIDMIPSQGAIHKQGDTWVPLDASFKQCTYSSGIDIKSSAPFDAQSFINQIQSTATINETEGYVSNVNSLYIQQQMQDYQTRIQNYISQNYPNATVGDVLGKKEVIKQEFPVLMGTLPYKTIVKGSTYASIPDNLRHKITFNLIKDSYDEIIGTPINITKSLPELAGKKITLSYSPATSADETIINSYLPKPHADGTPIQPNEIPSSLPAYLINLKPELRIDGVVVATGTTVGMGNTETFKMTFTSPNESPDVITNDVQAGGYLGIALDLGRISQEQMTALKTKLEVTKAKLEAQDYTGLTKDDIVGDLLYTTALSYYAKLDAIDLITAKTKGVIAIRLPSETISSFELKVNSFFGVPLSARHGGLSMDVDRAMVLVKALDGDINKPKQFVYVSGQNSSALEHAIPEQLFSTPQNPGEGISAVKALKIANDQGIPIYTINKTNIDSVLPQLQLDSGTITDIRNAVNAGKIVTVSKTDITFNGWTGCGYIVIDPNTGSGAYMISGGLNGSWYPQNGWEWYTFFFVAIAGPIIAGFLIAVFFLAIVTIFAALITGLTTLMVWLSAWATTVAVLLDEWAMLTLVTSLIAIVWYCIESVPEAVPTGDCIAMGVALTILSWLRFP